MNELNPFILIISGPTGVGKTDFVFELSRHFPLEFINADVGQFYTPLTIGTAKPNWRHETVPHHLFDILDEPKSLSVMQYRDLASVLIRSCWERKKIPVFVGGSLFYLKSLLFSQADVPSLEERNITIEVPAHVLWDELQHRS